MSEKNWGRRYILEIGPQGGTGFRIGGEYGKEEVLHVSFSVEKSDAESANTCKIEIWNLADETLKLLDEKDNAAYLKAGYERNVPLIFAGIITNVQTELDGSDRLTRLEVTDGRVALRDTTISTSINGKVDSHDIYEMIAKEMGLTIDFANDLEFKTFPNGYSFVGKGRNALQRVANANGHAWTIQNGIIQVTIPGRPINTKGYLLSSKTGLISIPKRVTISEHSDSNDSLTGWEVRYFLNGAIGINDVLQIQSSTANGYYRVCKLNIDGDNFEGDWLCVAQVLEIKALPKADKKAHNAITEKASIDGNVPTAKIIGKSISKGDKVRLLDTFTHSGDTYGYTSTGELFTLYQLDYEVLSVNGDTATIGKGGSIVAVVKLSSLIKMEK